MHAYGPLQPVQSSTHEIENLHMLQIHNQLYYCSWENSSLLIFVHIEAKALKKDQKRKKFSKKRKEPFICWKPQPQILDKNGTFVELKSCLSVFQVRLRDLQYAHDRN